MYYLKLKQAEMSYLNTRSSFVDLNERETQYPNILDTLEPIMKQLNRKISIILAKIKRYIGIPGYDIAERLAKDAFNFATTNKNIRHTNIENNMVCNMGLKT